MDFGKEKILRINESEDNFSDITFVGPCSMKRSDQQTSTQSQIHQLINEIKRNVWGYDLVLCLFVAALNSYRSDRCLRPFPPSYYIDEDGKDFNALRETCDKIPSLNNLLTEPNKCSQEVYTLLNWLFMEKNYPVLKRISFDSVTFPGKITNVFKPHFVFEILYNEKFESLWQKRQGGRETILAYHGSAIDNFYSILKVGLQQHFSVEKEVLFGNGIYLSSELSVSAHYAPFGQTWSNSLLGDKHSIIAVCEIINDVDKVKYKDAKNKKRALNENSLGEIPEKYFVVTDSDMVRVKYLMVYRQQKVFSVKSYLSQHLFVILLIFYFLFIIAIGFFSNTTYTKTFRKITKFLSIFD